jgi:RHS repeat-associated protein
MRSNWLAPNSYSIPTGGGKYLRRFCEQRVSGGPLSVQGGTQQETSALSLSRYLAQNQPILPDLRVEKTQQGTPGLLAGLGGESRSENSLNLDYNATTTQVTISYTYDSLYRLTDAVYSNGFEFHYTYDAVGNRLTQTTCAPNVPCATTTFSYDAANRLISVNGVTYTWDDNGNLLGDGTSTYGYDSQNRLTTLTQSGHTYAFTHNGNGDRLTQSVDGVVTRYTLDLEAGLTQVLSDGSFAYLYGNGRIAQMSNSEADYFLGDALGSVRQLVDVSGAVRLAKNYEPYGTVMGSAGSGASAYGFTGEQQNGQLLDLRARSYLTSLGVFASRDAWAGNLLRPQSLVRWSYTAGNPINRRDPSGHCWYVSQGNQFENDEEPLDFPCNEYEVYNYAAAERGWPTYSDGGTVYNSGIYYKSLFAALGIFIPGSEDNPSTDTGSSNPSQGGGSPTQPQCGQPGAAACPIPVAAPMPVLPPTPTPSAPQPPGVSVFGPRRPKVYSSTCYIPTGPHSAEAVPCGYAEDTPPDGYVLGVAGIVSVGAPVLGAWPSAMYPPNSCYSAHDHEAETANTTIHGREIVYDFFHLQRAEFEYTGIGMTSNANASGFAYEGFTSGFMGSRAYGIETYAGYSTSIGASGSKGIFGFGGNLNHAVDYWGHLASGVNSMTYGPSAGIGAGLGTLVQVITGFPVDVSVSMITSYYKMDPLSKTDYVAQQHGDGRAAVQSMKRDILAATWDFAIDLRKFGRTLIGQAGAIKSLEWWYPNP